MIPALEMMEALASAVTHLHEVHGLVHRDIKPSNILLHQGQPKLADFGIAALPGKATGLIAGATSGWAAPEQWAEGATPNKASDIFSLGAVLWATISGMWPPAQVKHRRKRWLRIEDVEAADAFTRQPDAVKELLKATLAQDPDQRIKTASKLGELCREIREGLIAEGPLKRLGGKHTEQLAALQARHVADLKLKERAIDAARRAREEALAQAEEARQATQAEARAHHRTREEVERARREAAQLTSALTDARQELDALRGAPVTQELKALETRHAEVAQRLSEISEERDGAQEARRFLAQSASREQARADALEVQIAALKRARETDAAAERSQRERLKIENEEAVTRLEAQIMEKGREAAEAGSVAASELAAVQARYDRAAQQIKSWQAATVMGVIGSALLAAGWMWYPSDSPPQARIVTAPTQAVAATPTQGSAATPPPALDELSQRRAAIGLKLVDIPGGTFTMGSAKDDKEAVDDEMPPHPVTVSAFRMGQTEVTVAQYRMCVEAGACMKPPDRAAYSSCNWVYADRDAHPINCVDWDQALSFTKWVGGVLPTEAQWEYAARGTSSRRYPWGNKPEPSCEVAVMEAGPESSNDGCGENRTWPVCSKPRGNTPEGLCDMAGSVWEWTSDWYAPSYYANSPTTDPPGAPSGSGRVIRGGSWINGARDLRAAVRSWGLSGNGYRNVGFRVAFPAPGG